MEQAAAPSAIREAHPQASPQRTGLRHRGCPQTLFAALQHMLAMFVAIITPPLIIANALGLPCRRHPLHRLHVPGHVRHRLLHPDPPFRPPSVPACSRYRGTSFNFLGPIIASGLALKQAAMPTDDLLGTLFGTMLAAAPPSSS